MGAVRHVSDGPSIREGSSRRNSRAQTDGISTALPRRETQEQQQPKTIHSDTAKRSKPKVLPILDCLLFGLNRYWRQKIIEQDRIAQIPPVASALFARNSQGQPALGSRVRLGLLLSP
jgi:hypothetical protein